MKFLLILILNLTKINVYSQQAVQLKRETDQSIEEAFKHKQRIFQSNSVSLPKPSAKIALNALNAGRIKLGAATGAAAIKVLNESIKYAIERKQLEEHTTGRS